jgi:hypothetical protein
MATTVENQPSKPTNPGQTATGLRAGPLIPRPPSLGTNEPGLNQRGINEGING